MEIRLKMIFGKFLNKDIDFKERRGIYLYFEDSPAYIFEYIL